MLIFALLIGYGYLHNLFAGNNWGTNDTQQGAIQATLVSTAALPLPQDHPPTDNVLATETPSPAPALEEQATEPLPLPEAVPIPEQQTPPKAAPKPQTQPPPRHPQPPPKTQHKANYGEAAQPNTPRSTANVSNANSPVAVTGGDFGTRFGWYVDVIKGKVAQNWYLPEVEQSTPVGSHRLYPVYRGTGRYPEQHLDGYAERLVVAQFLMSACGSASGYLRSASPRL